MKFAENKKQGAKTKSDHNEEAANINSNTMLWYGRDIPNAPFVVDSASAMPTNARHIFPPFTLPSSVPAVGDTNLFVFSLKAYLIAQIYDVTSIPFSSSFSHQVYSPVAGRQIGTQVVSTFNIYAFITLML